LEARLIRLLHWHRQACSTAAALSSAFRSPGNNAQGKHTRTSTDECTRLTLRISLDIEESLCSGCRRATINSVLRFTAIPTMGPAVVLAIDLFQVRQELWASIVFRKDRASCFDLNSGSRSMCVLHGVPQLDRPKPSDVVVLFIGGALAYDDFLPCQEVLC